MREETIYTVALTVLLLLYMSIGAVIFCGLESDNEVNTAASYRAIFNRFQIQHNISDDVMQRLLHAHEQASQLGITSQTGRKWDFAGAFYFAGTVISTIGFGLTAPATSSGQIFFIFYSMLGIPLHIIFLNTMLERIVSLLTSCINDFHRRLPKSTKFRKFFAPRAFPVGRLLFFSSIMFLLSMLLLTTVFWSIEEWSYFEAFYFSIVASTTVGFGDFVPSKTNAARNRHDSYRIMNWFFISLGVVMTYILLNLLANYLKTMLWSAMHWFIKRFCTCVSTQVEPMEIVVDGGKNMPKSPRMKRSRVSHGHEGDVGSFAAIQLALERIKTDAAFANSTDSQSGMKALSAIENMLRVEFKRVQMQQGDSAKARWLRAYSKVKSQSRINKHKAEEENSSLHVPNGQSCSSGPSSRLLLSTEAPFCNGNGHLPGQIEESITEL